MSKKARGTEKASAPRAVEEVEILADVQQVHKKKDKKRPMEEVVEVEEAQSFGATIAPEAGKKKAKKQKTSKE